MDRLNYVMQYTFVFFGMLTALFALTRIAWEFWSWAVLVISEQKPVLHDRPSIEIRVEIVTAALGITIVLMSIFGRWVL